MQENILNLLDSYLYKYPKEKSRIQRIYDCLEKNLDVSDRTNMAGHLTGSAIVLDESNQEILMLKHKALNMWLAPGGHVDPDETPEEATIRELAEETSIRDESVQCQLIDIDVHPIPARPEKNEENHFHFDFRYLFTLKKKPDVRLEKNESLDYAWLKLDDVKDTYPEIYEKLSV